MKNLYTVACGLLLLSATSVLAQDALTMQDINFNRFNYNTAFIAEKNESGLSLTNTNGGAVQNTGQLNFTAYTQLKSAQIAIGTHINSKYFGLYRTSSFELDFAKSIKLSENSILMAGLGLGLQFTSIRSGELNQYVDQADAMLATGVFPQYRFVNSLGLGYIWKDKLTAGISLPSFAKTESSFNPIFIANGSYKIVAKQDLMIVPELLLFGSGVKPFSAEINSKAVYKDKVWVKLGYRSTNTFVGALGVNLSGFSIGYAYNAYYQEFRTIIPRTHNINITFQIAGK